MTENYLPYEQQGVTYNLYDMPKGFKFLNTVDLSHNNLEKLPDLSECYCLMGFKCSHNPLKNLRGAPKEVQGDFDASCCQLESTDGISKKIGGTLNLSLNRLQKLDNFPQKVAEDVLLDRNPLESLAGLATAEIGKKIYADDALLQKYNLDPRDGCVLPDKLRSDPIFQAETKASGISVAKIKTPKSAQLNAVKRQEKWHRLKMECITKDYPKISGDEFFAVIQKASNASCDGHTPVYTDFGRGFAIPKDTKFYDACFMALEQTDNDNPQAKLLEAERIRQAVPDMKFGKDMSIRLAFYMHKIICEHPEQAGNFSQAALADAYPVLRQMEAAENKIALPVVKKELKTRFPQKLQELQQANAGLTTAKGRTL